MGTAMKERIGEESFNSQGTKMILVEYTNSNHILVEFQDEHKTIVKTAYNYFRRKRIANPYDKTIYNIGFLGIGIYKSHTKANTVWKDMLRRCYVTKLNKNNKKSTYYGIVTVCEDWLNYQNFAKWYEENYYEIEGKVMCLDKDILHKGNKIYSPDTCVFVPQNINNILCKRDVDRGEYPIGVTKRHGKIKYRSACSNGETGIFLGDFDTVCQAFEVYKTFKEKVIKKIANQYIDKIPLNLYEAMINYKVEIND